MRTSHRSEKLLRAVLVIAPALALLDGCGTVTFKRGASSGAMEADERACRDATTNEAAYVECMRDRGWYIGGAGAAPDTQATETPIPRPTASTESVPGIPAATPTATVTTNPPKADAPEPPPSVTPAAAAVLTPVVAAPPSQATVEASPEPSDPLARVEVASWWKLGGSPAGLERAIEACVAKLGEAHRPDPGARIVTAGMRTCLREAGWYPFGK